MDHFRITYIIWQARELSLPMHAEQVQISVMGSVCSSLEVVMLVRNALSLYNGCKDVLSKVSRNRLMFCEQGFRVS